MWGHQFHRPVTSACGPERKYQDEKLLALGPGHFACTSFVVQCNLHVDDGECTQHGVVYCGCRSQTRCKSSIHGPRLTEAPNTKTFHDPRWKQPCYFHLLFSSSFYLCDFTVLDVASLAGLQHVVLIVSALGRIFDDRVARVYLRSVALTFSCIFFGLTCLMFLICLTCACLAATLCCPCVHRLHLPATSRLFSGRVCLVCSLCLRSSPSSCDLHPPSRLFDILHPHIMVISTALVFHLPMHATCKHPRRSFPRRPSHLPYSPHVHRACLGLHLPCSRLIALVLGLVWAAALRN